MDEPILFVDGGTTNTRFTLMFGGTVLERSQRRVGAANSSNGKYNDALGAAVISEVHQMEQTHGIAIRRVCACGMITSASGLTEVPHICAPAGIKALAQAVKCIRLPEISPDLEFAFIPGVKGANNSMLTSDMMRGEETEIMGILTEKCEQKRLLAIHFGSHNKIIDINKGEIHRSVTTLSGELLHIITQDTILKSSVCDLNGIDMDEAFVHMGYETAEKEGMSRALFVARLYQVLEHASPLQVSSFLLGILTQQDSVAFSRFFYEAEDEIILYGRDTFSDAFLLCMRQRLKDRFIRKIPFADSQWLSVRGMQQIIAESEVFSHTSID